MYKVNDLIFLPNAYEWVYESTLTKIEHIENGMYYCYVSRHPLTSFNSPAIRELAAFTKDEIFANKADCDEYISHRYYDRLCKTCKYNKDAGIVLTCATCGHNIKNRPTSATDWSYGICEMNGIKVWSGKTPTRGFEICQHYSPTLPQYKDWDYDRYEDLLRNCEFNTNCPHHQHSIHKTCTYDRYMNELINLPVNAMYDGEKIDGIYIKRFEWVDNSFRINGGYLVHGIHYPPVVDKRGKLKKGTVNKSKMFNERVKVSNDDDH